MLWLIPGSLVCMIAFGIWVGIGRAASTNQFVLDAALCLGLGLGVLLLRSVLGFVFVRRLQQVPRERLMLDVSMGVLLLTVGIAGIIAALFAAAIKSHLPFGTP